MLVLSTVARVSSQMSFSLKILTFVAILSPVSCAEIIHDPHSRITPLLTLARHACGIPEFKIFAFESRQFCGNPSTTTAHRSQTALFLHPNFFVVLRPWKHPNNTPVMFSRHALRPLVALAAALYRLGTVVLHEGWFWCPFCLRLGLGSWRFSL